MASRCQAEWGRGGGGAGSWRCRGAHLSITDGRNERIWRCYPGQMPAAPPFMADNSSPKAPPRTLDSQGSQGPDGLRSRRPENRGPDPGTVCQEARGRRRADGTSPCRPGMPGTRPRLRLPGNLSRDSPYPSGGFAGGGVYPGLRAAAQRLRSQPPPALTEGSRHPASRRGLPAHGFPFRPHCCLSRQRLSRPHSAHEEAEAQRGQHRAQGHTVGRWQGWGLKPACGPNPPPHLCVWEGSRMKSSPGPGPPEPLIRTTWEELPTPT